MAASADSSASDPPDESTKERVLARLVPASSLPAEPADDGTILPEPLNKGPYFFDARLFPELRGLLEHLPVIRAEAANVVRDDSILSVDPCFAEWAEDASFGDLAATLDKSEGGWVNWWNNARSVNPDNDRWSVFGFVHGQGQYIEANCARCPRTAELLKAIPCIRVAGFSRLQPGAEIKPHRGFTGLEYGALAFHMGLFIPADGSCVLHCGAITHTWTKPGQQIVFDDCFTHWAWNRSTESMRVVLYIDFCVSADELRAALLA